MKIIKKCIATVLWLYSLSVVADELHTDWIKPVKGESEGVLGAEIRAVEPSQDGGASKVTISIPKSSVEDPRSMQEVVIYGRKPDKSEAKIEIRHEWVADYDKDYYGLVLYIGKDSNLPLRLYLKAHDEP